MLVGNVVALLSPVVFIPILTYAFGPQNYDWQSMLAIRLGDDKEVAEENNVDLESIPAHYTATQIMTDSPAFIEEQKMLTKNVRIAGGLTVFLAIAFLVLWPMPMFGSSYVFSKPFFTGWVVVGIIWIFFTTAAVGVYPLWEGRKSIARVFGLASGDLRGRRHPVLQGEGGSSDNSSQEVIGEINEKPKQ